MRPDDAAPALRANRAPLPEAALPPGPAARAPHWGWSALLVALPVLLYARALGYGLLELDDGFYFRDNPALHGGALAGLIDCWRAPYFHDYSPITTLTIWLDRCLSAPGHYGIARLQELLWLGLGNLALFQLLRRLTGQVALAGIVALLVSVHPVVTESALWLGERKNVVALALSWWAVERHLAWRQGAGRRAFAAAIALTVLALLAKPHAVVIPVLLATYELLLGRARWPDRVLAVLPSVLATVAFLLVSMAVFHLYGSEGPPQLGGSLAATLGCDGAILARYLGHTLLPHDLALYYHVDEDPAQWPLFLGAWLVVLAVVAGTVALARDRRLLGFAWGAALGSLLPVLNLKPLPLPMTDHYLQWCLPWLLLILCLAVRDGLHRLALARPAPAAPPAPLPERWRRGAGWAAAALGLSFVLAATVRVPAFRSREGIALEAALHQPACALGWADLCLTEANKPHPDFTLAGRAGLTALRCDDARRIFHRAALSCAIFGTLVCQRQEGAAAGEALLAQALDRLSALDGTFVRGSILLLNHETASGIAVLAPLYDPERQAAARTIAARCVDGAVQPWDFPPLSRDPPDPEGDPSAPASAVRLQALAMLSQAYLAQGAVATAAEVAALALNGHPHARLAARAYRAVCVAQGRTRAVARIDRELLDPAREAEAGEAEAVPDQEPSQAE